MLAISAIKAMALPACKARSSLLGMPRASGGNQNCEARLAAAGVATIAARAAVRAAATATTAPGARALVGQNVPNLWQLFENSSAVFGQPPAAATGSLPTAPTDLTSLLERRNRI